MIRFDSFIFATAYDNYLCLCLFKSFFGYFIELHNVGLFDDAREYSSRIKKPPHERLFGDSLPGIAEYKS